MARETCLGVFDDTTRPAEDKESPPAKRPHSAPSRTGASSAASIRAPTPRARPKPPTRAADPRPRTSSLTPGAAAMDISVSSASSANVESYFMLPRGAEHPDEYYRVPHRVMVNGVMYDVTRSGLSLRIVTPKTVLVPVYAAEPERVVRDGVFLRVYVVQSWVEFLDLTD